MFRNKLKMLIGNNENKEGIEGEKNQKKKIENLIFFVVLLIITIIAINIIWNGDKETKSENTDSGKKLASQTNNVNNNNINTNSSTNTDSNLDTELEEILSKIQGVGEVHVFINYSESSEVVAMYNENSKTSTTEETDTSGGVRKIQETDIQKDIIYQEDDGEKTPITQKVIKPKIEGAIITAKGASNADVKTNIIQAVEAVTGLATHKIQVFELN